ncbi:hypothetical protein ES689_12620 [Frigoribacterium sp. ACAM 257]|uniref:DUF6932 family protein n=1 Tax=Frigoribacterium sp. ACAM 257 TaxID=2508998 RepID=UPI0011B9E14C|nr:hypothetical protein [Frigoribacterium sp. ACAM 257]TWX36241.1 hypothetical protein ES689_12620 [Frigoribacterium sp. ACAM 257]
MTIPVTAGPYGLLPAGRHACTVDELEQHFVVSAPFPDERRQIFDAFRVWARAVGDLLPGARCWVDGGFVTHKTWAAPRDVDVVVFTTAEVLDALPESDQQLLMSMMTQHSSGIARVQPMAGLVDGFLGLRDDADRTIYWRNLWSGVKDVDGSKVDAVQKGFLEVTL